MEREFLLTTLITLLGGLALQLSAHWPTQDTNTYQSKHEERRQWARLWWPLAPTLAITAWLCGWALSQPDPVPDRVGYILFVWCAPFGYVVLRALLRAGWSLRYDHTEHGIAAVGLLKPRIVVSPNVASLLDPAALHAALEHEKAHIRHQDPLRIWMAQLVTDLQWPWPSAQRRFSVWLAALECARDDEARAAGIDGADLAAAVLTCLRFQSGLSAARCARVTGNAAAVQERIARLLGPLPPLAPSTAQDILKSLLLLASTAVLAVALGVAYGEPVIRPLLALTS